MKILKKRKEKGEEKKKKKERKKGRKLATLNTALHLHEKRTHVQT